MPRNFFPTSDSPFETWSKAFADRLNVRASSLGVPQTVADDLSAVQATYASALEAAIAADTRGESTIRSKNRAKTDLIAEVRTINRFLQGSLTVTDAQRADLGLPTRDRKPTPVPPPELRPVVKLVAVTGQILRVELSGGVGRARPVGVAGTSIMTHLGEAMPAELADWTFQGSTSRMTMDVDFGPVPPGAMVWVSAFFYNAKGQSGLAAVPASTRLAGDGVAKAA